MIETKEKTSNQMIIIQSIDDNINDDDDCINVNEKGPELKRFFHFFSH